MLPQEVDAWIAKMNKELKAPVIVPASALAVPVRFTTGSLGLDVILGGGFPGNQWCEVFGDESAGKTFLAYKSIAANQRLRPDFTTFWVASEHYNGEWAAALGVDNNRVVAMPTNNMEMALQLILEALESKLYDCIVLDSFPALSAEEELDKAMDEFSMAMGAKRFGQFWRKQGDAGHRAYDGSERPFYGIIINQNRDAMKRAMPGMPPPKTQPGGKAKNYFYYTRVEVKRTGWLTEKRPGVGDVKVGQTNKLVSVKNKSAAPQQTVELDLYYRDAPFAGFSRGDYDVAKEFVSMAKLLGVFGRRGSWLDFGGQSWNGEKNLMADIYQDRDLQDAIRKEVLEAAADPRRLDMVAADG